MVCSWSFSVYVTTLVSCSFRGLKTAINMASILVSSSSSSAFNPPFSYVRRFFEGPASDRRGDDDVNMVDECRVLTAEEPVSMEKGLSSFVKLKRRPAKIVVPEYCPDLFGGQMKKKMDGRELIEVRGRDFCLASKRGRREVMEDSYAAMADVLGDQKQAFFAVIDGHGGRSAADYVAENLGKNIVKELEMVNGDEELAIRRGYEVTDNEFLRQGVSSGACAASVLVRGGELHVANVGDCRIVLSRKGEAHPLTNDHRLCRVDERVRIENSGGLVDCRNGVWRAQGCLAVSRAIGDLHMKEFIISEPEIIKLPLTPDCQFLIMASDGLWDKVNEDEAVGIVCKYYNNDEDRIKCCKELVEMSCRRGNLDDITVMMVDLQGFC